MPTTWLNAIELPLAKRPARALERDDRQRNGSHNHQSSWYWALGTALGQDIKGDAKYPGETRQCMCTTQLSVSSHASELQNDMYDSHICGEGGEYETFTLDCPMFQKRIGL